MSSNFPLTDNELCRFRDFLVFTAWRQKDARNGWQVQQSKQLRMIAVG
jgi:hypothetical protein